MANINYNKEKVLLAKYKCLVEKRENFNKKTIHVELENDMVPVGADYVHGTEYSAGREAGVARKATRDRFNAPTVVDVGASNKSADPINSIVIYSLTCATILPIPYSFLVCRSRNPATPPTLSTSQKLKCSPSNILLIVALIYIDYTAYNLYVAHITNRL